MMIVVATFIGCSKTPDGVINEDDMAHVLADFAKAEQLIAQNPELFPNDSSKLLLKQSILKKYNADLAKYDSSLVWYAHNLKVYSQVHDKAIEILEKESNNGKPVHTSTTGGNYAVNGQGSKAKRSFPTSGDSANVWQEPQQWILTNAMRDGYIKFDYKPDNDSRKGDKYALCFKMANSGNAISMLMAIDYQDGCTSYVNRTAQANGWVENAIQGDSSKVIKRIYGFIKYKTRPHGITFIDSTYLLRTHFDRGSYSTISQRIVGPKAIIEQQNQNAAESENATTPPLSNQPQNNISTSGQPQRGNQPPNNYPGRPAGSNPERTAPNEQGSYKPKPGLNKSSPQRRGVVPNPNGDHLPRPTEK
ncbi:MAG: DUF4296 domain-containing protein [Muribaculaceae bacterium]|nr:DUF4296 domain-containing protein [Muribaculaceae bacterium]